MRMKMEREIEFKKILSKKEYKRINSTCFDNYSMREFININYYFDTVDYYYHKHKISIKVRKVKSDVNKLDLIVKMEKKKENSLRTSEEYKFDLSEEELKKLIYLGTLPLEFKHFLEKMLLPANIHFCGTLITNRKQFYNSEVEISLDKNEYLNHVDYEVEIEGENVYNDKKLVEFVSSFGKKDNSKYQRFMLKKLQNKQAEGMKVQVSGVVFNGNKVLLIKKELKGSSVNNKLLPPGGHIDNFESPEEAVIREVYEETGVSISDLKLSSVVNFQNKESMKQSICCFFFKCVGSGEIEIKEHGIYPRWMRVDELKNCEMITDYHKKLIIDSFQNNEGISFYNVNTEREEFKIKWM